MKIRVTYYQYPSKLATFVSLLKSGIAGFAIWLIPFFVPAFIFLIGEAEGALIGGLFGGGFGLALLTYIIFCIKVDAEKINDKYLKKNPVKISVPQISPLEMAAISNQIEEDKSNKRNAFYQHLLLIPRDYAFGNGLRTKYQSVELEIGASISAHLKIFELMFKDFYLKEDENNRATVETLEDFAFSIGIYHLFDLEEAFPDVRTGDIVGIIESFDRNQFNLQCSLFDNPDMPKFDRESLIEAIKKGLKDKEVFDKLGVF